MIRPIEVNLAGRVAVVTGANTGLGKEIARDLARLNARVILACRDEARGRAAVDAIVADTGNHKTEARVLDVSSRASIALFVRRLAAEHPAVHVLVNNAGVWRESLGHSADGVELTWGTNVLGSFLLTREVTPLLDAGAQGDSARTARVVNIASELAGSLDLGDVELERRGYQGVVAYRQSKQANRMLTRAFARRLSSRRITVTSMHPGWVDTEIACRDQGLKGWLMTTGGKLFARTPARGADTATWLAASVEVEGATGGFYVDRQERACRFTDEREEEALYLLCERMTGVRPQSTASTTLPKPSLLAT